MKAFLFVSLLYFVSSPISGQTSKVDKASFFADTSVLKATLVTDMTRVLHMKNKKNHSIPGNFLTTLPDGTLVNDSIHLEKRGHFRSDYCYVPPIKMVFNENERSVYYTLKSLKLVSECKISKFNEQLLLKEYLTYKIFNLLTDISFRVRLLKMTLQDSNRKSKPITEYAFLLEDIKELAKRNNCAEWKGGKLNTEATQRKQMTMVAIFEYMIGNTDWAVSVNHNIKLIFPPMDSLARPIAVPYDFDYAGLVNADYAIPDERLEIENVRQRVYRGYPRTSAELEVALDIFRQQQSKIYETINHFDLLTPDSKKNMTDYLDDFYKIINQSKKVKSIFIDNALIQ